MANSLRLWRPRFTLAALLVLITVIAIPLSYVAQRRSWNLKRKAAYEALLACGSRFSVGRLSGQVASKPPVTPNKLPAKGNWWRTLTAEPDIPPFTRIEMQVTARPKATMTLPDKTLANVAYFPEVEEISIWGANQVTDRGLDSIAGLPKLKLIHLARMGEVTGSFLNRLHSESPLQRLELLDLKQLRGENLGAIDRLNALTSLKVTGAPAVKEESLARVMPPKSLKELELTGVDIGDASLSRWLEELTLEKLVIDLPISRGAIGNLAKQVGLKQLTIINAPLADEDFAFLKRFDNLAWLRLGGMPINGDLLDYIARPERLEILELDNSLFHDAQMAKLKRFRKLQSLCLAWTPLTGEGIDENFPLPPPPNLRLSGCQFSEEGKNALAQLEGLVTVVFPSNWTLEDLNRFPSGISPSDSLLNAFVIPRESLQSKKYYPYLPMQFMRKIDRCPTELMKKVIELQTKGAEEQRSFVDSGARASKP